MVTETENTIPPTQAAPSQMSPPSGPMGVPVVDADDATQAYQEKREELEAQADLEYLESLYGKTGTEEQSRLPAAITSPTQEQGAVFVRGSSGDAGDLDALATFGEKIFNKENAKDFAKGVTYELPRAIVGGVRDAFQSTIDLVDELQSWMGKNTGDVFGGRLAYDEKGNLKALGRKDFEEMQAKKDKPTSFQLPAIDKPKSVTGVMVHDTAQFLTGFIGAGKFVKGAGYAADAAKGAIAAFTAFDGQEKRLSNLIEEHPALRNPVTEFLSANPDDTKLEGRFKNALEGLGLGIVADGMITGLKAIRASRIARTEARAMAQGGAESAIEGAEAVAKIKPAPITQEELDAFFGGNESGKFFKTLKSAEDTKLTASIRDANAKPNADTVEINFNRIKAPDDVKKMIQDMANTFSGAVKDSQRGERSHRMTKLSANQQDAWKLVMERRTGEAFNAEQSLAARQLWVTSANRLKEAALQSAIEPSEKNLYVFRKMAAIHNAVQKEVLGVRTETARALNSWNIPAGGNDRFAKNITKILEENGGREISQEMAEKVAKLAQAGNDHALEQFVMGSTLSRTREAIGQVWINSLLSNPTTHISNAISNFTSLLQTVTDRKVASYISQVLGTENGVAADEALHMAHGMITSFQDAMVASAKTLKSGETNFGFGRKAENPFPGALKAETWGMASTSDIGRALDVVDSVSQTPGRLLGASDEFFKTLGYRMELHAQAARMARAEVDSGKILPSMFEKRISEIISHPPEEVKIEAVNAALYTTFNNKPEETLSRIGIAIQRVPVLGRMLLPFKNTPINILTQAVERTPMAPLIKSWRADIAAGGARADIAMARTATGSLLLMTVIDQALKGNITGKGPQEPGQRANWKRLGNQEYSVKIGDKSYSFSRVDPIGMTMGLGADIAEAIVNARDDVSDEDFEKAMIHATFAISNNVLSKTYMRSMSDFIGAVRNPEREGDRFVQRMTSSIIPAVTGNLEKVGIPGVIEGDPYMRATDSVVDALRAKIPGLSKDLPLYRNLWGEPMDSRSGAGWAYDALSPVYLKVAKPQAIDQEIERLEYYPQMPNRKISYQGVLLPLDTKQYSRYVELAGNEIKHPAWNMGCRDFLNAVVSGEHPLSTVYNLYSDGPEGGKAQFIQKILSDYRKLASEQLIQEDGSLRADYDNTRPKYGNGRLNPSLFGGE